MRRNWSAQWFKPIARIGEVGNDEYILEPINLFTPHAYKKNILPDEKNHFEPIVPASAATGMEKSPTPADRKSFSTRITAHKAGKLFLYVNDAVLAEPLKHDMFYPNNFGCAEVTVDRLRPDGSLCRLMPVAEGEAPPADEMCAEADKEASAANICGLSGSDEQR